MTTRPHALPPRGKGGRFITAERTTETTTHRVTERVSVEEHHDDTEPIRWAPGWSTPDLTRRQAYRAQRISQQERAEELITDWVLSVPPGTPQPEWLQLAVRNILRAGPRATPLELKWGRIA